METDKRRKYDWAVIQTAYDTGLSCRDLMKIHGMTWMAFNKAVARGEFKMRSNRDGLDLYFKNNPPTLRKHSQETKDKISKIRKEYLALHPEKVPYRLNHSSKRSYPELMFEKALTEAGIVGWTTEYNCGVYRFDFAFPNLKIDVEIDGATHLQSKVIEIDKERDTWSKSLGWTVIRFTAIQIKKDVKNCMSYLKEIIAGNPNAEYRYVEFIKKEEFENNCKRCNKPTNNPIFCSRKCNNTITGADLLIGRNAGRNRKFNPSKEELEKLVWEIPTTKVGLMFGVTGKSVEKRCKLYGIQKPARGYWAIQDKFKLNISIKKLKRLIWEKPIKYIAKELSVSDSWLCEYCKKHNIDTPPVGYWTGLDYVKS